MVNVVGTLVDPLGNAIANAAIRFTAIGSSGSTPASAEAIFTTDGSGNYDFTLENGSYLLECNVTDYFNSTDTVIVDDGLPASVDLITLVAYSGEEITLVVIPEDPIWQTLHDDIRNGINSSLRSQVDQVTNEDNTVNQYKKLWENTDSVAMSEDTLTTSIGSTSLEQQSNVYEDPNLNQSIQYTRKGTTTNASYIRSQELYDASNSNVTYEDSTVANILLGLSTDTLTVDSTTTKHKKELLFNGDGFTQEIVSKDNYTNFTNSTKLTEGEFIIDRVEITTNEYPYLDSQSNTVNKPSSVLDKSTNLTADIHNGRLFEYGYLRLNASDEMESLYERGVTVYTKDIYQRFTNTGVSTKSETKTDIYSIVDDTGSEIFEVDTVNKTVNINAQLSVTNAVAFKGEDGDTIFEVFQYSKDKGVTDAWHEEFDPAHGDIWRRHALSTNGSIGTWSEPYNLFAEDGADGDTIYFEYEYSDDQANWHSVFTDGDIWRRERIITNGTPSTTWSAPARIRGSDGADGEITEVTYQYSTDGFDPWHSNFSTGDHYRRERTEYFYTAADRDAVPPVPHTVTPWSSAAKIVPIDGEDFGYKNATVYLYQKKATKPNDPSADITFNFTTLGVTGLTEGWETTIPEGDVDVWIAIASVWSMTDTDIISPNEWVIEKLAPIGIDGINGTFKSFVYKNSATIPDPITDTGSYNGSVETPPDGWTDNPVSPPTGQVTYVATANYEHDRATNNWKRVGWVDGVTTGWSAPARFSGFEGDTIYIEYRYSSDNTSWHDDYLDTDYYRSERTVTVSSSGTSYSTWSEGKVIRVDGYTPIKGVDYVDGVDGSFVSFVYKLSNSSVTPAGGSYDGTTEVVPSGWSDNPVYSATVKTQVSTCRYKFNGTAWVRDPDWSASVQYLGQDGAEGLDGNYTSFVFRNAATKPNRPTNGSFNGSVETTPTTPDVWDDDPTTPTGTDKTWVSTVKYTVDVNGNWSRVGDWSDPTQWSGENGYQSVTVMLYKLGATVPAVPNNTITYTFANGALTGSLDGWSKTVPNNTADGGKVWVTFNTAFAQVGNATDVLDVADWSTPTVMSQNGVEGPEGQSTNGLHGTGSYVYTTTASKATVQGYSQATKDSHFNSAAGRIPQNLDMLAYVNNTDTTEENRFRLDYIYDGTDWQVFLNVVDGNQIVHGTVAAEQIKTNAIDSGHINTNGLSAQVIKSGSISLGGSGYDVDVPLIIRNSSGDSLITVNSTEGEIILNNCIISGDDAINAVTTLSEAVRGQLNPDYIIGGGSSSKQTTGSLTSGQSSTDLAVTATKVGAKVAVSFDLSKYVEGTQSSTYTTPVWEVQIQYKIGAGSYNNLGSKFTFTGSSSNGSGPWYSDAPEPGYNGYYKIDCKGSLTHVTTSSGSHTYKIVVTKVSGSATSLKVTEFYAGESAFLENSSTKAANGYWKDKESGVMFQWGKVLVNNDTSTVVTFPIAFPSACTSFVVSLADANGRDRWGPKIHTPARTGSRIYNTNGGGSDDFNFYWMAMGY